jgi:mycobactin lysine-N-oxygenase
MKRRLLVIGAGPKGIALAAKARELCDLLGANSVPEVLLIERKGIGANWSGTSGFTDGDQVLGTPPEKDIGFPYATAVRSFRGVDEAMIKYGWKAFLVGTGDTDAYGDWVDKGKPHPTHREWAQYLRWVAAKASASVLEETEVLAVDAAGGEWALSCRNRVTNRTEEIRGNGLIVTGPGTARVLRGPSDGSTRVFDGQSFWLPDNLARLRTELTARDAVAVIGSGETAASVIVSLIEMTPSGTNIKVINRQGAIFSRGESFVENLYGSVSAKRVGGR